MEIEFNELDFHVQKPSSLNSFSMNSAPMGLLQNGLDQSVRLLANEFIELVFIELGIWTLSLNSEDGKLVPSLAASTEDGPYQIVLRELVVGFA